MSQGSAQIPLSERKATREKPSALVVDDVADIAFLFAFVLEREGYKVVTRCSAPAALLAARSEHFDVVVLDIGLPGMDGYELAMALRAMPEYQDVPMVAVSAKDNDPQRASGAGFTAYLHKPVDPDRLVKTITSL